MNRNVVVILFITVIVGAITIFYLYIKQYSPEYNWVENYKKENDQPYGLKLFYDLLDQQNNDITTIKNSFRETLDTTALNSNYIAFGSYLYIDSVRAHHILRFVEKGNTALIASSNAPLELTRNLLPPSDTIYDYDYSLDSIISVSFKDSIQTKKLSFHYQYLKDTALYYWESYTPEYFTDTLINYGFNPVSYVNGNINCYSFDYGEGRVVIHTNPILFSNYNIIQKNGFDNANHILSLLNKGDIYWDELSQKPIYNFGSNGLSSGNPLQFLFSHYTLRWGWYLFLVTVLIYLLFRTKREQRIIPILPKNTNSTIAYTKAIGILYFQKGQHKLIANELYTLLLAHLRTRYNINTDIKEPELIEKISIRSGIDQEEITKMFKHFRKVKYSPMANSKDLINLHHVVESYYKNCN